MLCRIAFRTLIALGIVSATAIGLSLVPSVRMRCPATSTFPKGWRGDDWRYLERGSLVRDRRLDPENPPIWWTRFSPPGSTWNWRWTVEPERIDISVPVWPLPIVLLAAGWMVGRRAKPIPTSSAFGKAARRGGVALILLGASTATIVILSFLCSDGITGVTLTSGSNALNNPMIRRWGSANGELYLFTEGIQQIAAQGLPKFMQVLVELDRSTPQIAFPIWPLPILLLTGGLFLGRKSSLAIRRAAADHCPNCGYSLAGLAARACPECGASSPAAHA